MERFWITMAHAAALVAQGALAAGAGVRLVTAHDPVELPIGEVADEHLGDRGAAARPTSTSPACGRARR